MAGSLIQELKRRNVFRVAIIYIVVSWLLMQIGDVMFPALRLPEWTTTLLVAFLILGFPVAVIFAWAFELTPDGVVRTTEVPAGQSITAATGQKINYTIIGALVVAVVFLLAKDFLRTDGPAQQAVAVADQSIAVLPFKNQSASAENAEFFAGGLHDELLTLLSKLGDMKVISRTSVERLDPTLSIPEIGALLGVATVLEGQVQRAGNRLRINVQLIDTADEDHLWANTYNSELSAENVFEVQSDIARTIANALRAELSPGDEDALGAIPTTNTAALEKYLLATQVAKRQTYDALYQAETYMQEATELDASFANAWAGLAQMRGELFRTGAIGLQQYADGATIAIAKALAIDPKNANALAVRGQVQHATGDSSAAEESFREALEIEPGSSRILGMFGEMLRTLGRLEDAKEVLATGLALDPLSFELLFQLGRTEMYLGYPERNIEMARRIQEIEPLNINGYVALLQANLWRGRYDEAWPWYVKTLSTDPSDYETWGHIGCFMSNLGLPEIADRYLERARSLGPDEPVVAKCTSTTLTNRGQMEQSAALADRMLSMSIGDRWDSDRVLLRAVRDQAFTTGDLAPAIAHYRNRRPELFSPAPVISPANATIAADLALLLRRSGNERQAHVLVDAALEWYRQTQPAGVYGYVYGTLEVHLLVLNGEQDLAMAALEEAINGGYRWQWKWDLANPTYDPLRDRPEFQKLLVYVAQDMARQRDAVLAYPHQGELDLRDQPAE
jgi:TolB-like protein/Tfp pilus assembly protein PilF